MSTRNTSFGSAVIESVVVQGIILLVGILSLFFLTHIMAQRDVGVYLVAFSLSNSAVILFGLGLPQAFAVRASEFGRHRLIASAGASSLMLAVGAGCMIWIALKLFWPDTDLVYRGVPVVPLLTTASYLNVMGNSLLRSMLAIRAANILLLLPNLLFSLTLAAIFSVGEGISAANGLFVLLLPQIAALIGHVVSLLRLGAYRCPRPAACDVRNLLQFGGILHIGNALKEIMYRAPLIIVQILMGSVAAASFGVANRLLDAITRFVDAICLNLIPFIASSNRSRGEVIKHLAMDVVVAGFVPGVIMVSLLSTALIPRIFGAAYAESAVLLRYAVFAVIPLAIWKVLANETIARVDIRAYLISAMAGATTMTGLGFALISQLGLFGAVVAMLLAYCVALSVLLAQRNGLRGYVPLRAAVASFSAKLRMGDRTGE